MPFWPEKKNTRSITPAQIQEVPNTKLHYTVTPIGGPERLAAWKLNQVKLEQQWQAKQDVKRRQQRKAAIAIVDMSLSAPNASYDEQRETSWLDRWLKKNPASPPLKQKIQKKSFISKVKGFVFNAFFNKSSDERKTSKRKK